MKLRYFDICKRMSKQSDHKDHKIGAVLVRKNRIITASYNKVKTHPDSNSYNRSTHAELGIILSGRGVNFQECELYIFRETKAGILANSRPCKYCEKLLKTVQLRNIHYTIDNGYKSEKL